MTGSWTLRYFFVLLAYNPFHKSQYLEIEGGLTPLRFDVVLDLLHDKLGNL